MNEVDTRGLVALERNLQKAFKAVQSFYSPLQTIITETKPIVSSVSNLLEQRTCCKSVDYSSVPFATSFPDMKVLLIAKIEEEIAVKLKELEQKICLLKEKQEAVSKHCESSVNIAQKYLGFLDFCILSKAGFTAPSIADMVEWLEEISILLSNQYLCKLHLLQSVLTEEAMDSQKFEYAWQEGDEVMLNTIRDRLSRVEQFLSEKR